MPTDPWVLVRDELVVATHKFGPFANGYEGWAIICEEVDELWDAVKANDIAQARREAVQVAAMGVRFLIDIGVLADPWVLVRAELVLMTRGSRTLARSHAAYAMIKAALDTLWDAVKADDALQAQVGAVRVAAAAIRFLVDTEGVAEGGDSRAS